MSVSAGGDLKDGGNIAFRADELKPNSAIGPVDIGTKLYRAMAEGATFESELLLTFKEGGEKNTQSRFQQAREKASEDVGLLAEFGEEEA